jgi:anaerobic ribonucleoside-triphosphate reductase activating protein
MNKIILADEYKKAIIESVVDGEGIRLVMFTCGCPHHCNECHNSKTWDIKNGVETDIDILVDYLVSKFANGRFSGITFSGGDPLFQSSELLLLIERLKEFIPDVNIWCYTGYTYENVKNLEVIKYIDVLVDGRFEEDKKFPKKLYRGSNNQRLIRLKNSEILKIE